MFSVTVYLFKIGVICNDADLTDEQASNLKIFFMSLNTFLSSFILQPLKPRIQDVLTVYLAISKEAHVVQHNQSSLEKSRCRFHRRRKGKMSEADRPKRFD